MGFEAETHYSFRILYLLNKRLLFFFTKPLPLEFMGSGKQNPMWLHSDNVNWLILQTVMFLPDATIVKIH